MSQNDVPPTAGSVDGHAHDIAGTADAVPRSRRVDSAPAAADHHRLHASCVAAAAAAARTESAANCADCMANFVSPPDRGSDC